MASLCNIILFLGLIGTLLSFAQSLTCSSQSFHNRKFTNCDDLSHLNAFLHWTYNPQNSSLSIAFLAPPPHSGGWVAWALNPTGTGMAGAQALIASLTDNAPSIRTFNISSHSSVLPSPLSFPVSDLSVEFSDDQLTIFATVKVPAKAKSLNQVWQVGPTVDPESGVPEIHEFTPANLNAKSVLVFDRDDGVGLAPRARADASSASSPAAVGVNETATATSSPTSVKGGVARIRNENLGLGVGLSCFIWGDY